MLTGGSLALANAKLLLHAGSADQDQQLRTDLQNKYCCKGDCIAMMCITRRELRAEIHQELLGPLAGALDWKQQTPSAQHPPPVTFPKKWSSPPDSKSNKPRYISLDVSEKGKQPTAES
jgi:hypothetical protein